jgi:cytoskeletal protein CcmA (bactofilin family)
VGGIPGDGDKSLQFNSGSIFSGSSNLTFDYNTDVLALSGSFEVSGSDVGTVEITGSLIVSGSGDGSVGINTATPEATLDVNGTTKFGSLLTDTHQFTGSILQTGSGGTSVFIDNIEITGSLSVTGDITGSNISASFFYGDGSALTNVTASEIEAAGDTNDIQYNLNDDLTGSNNFTFDNTTLKLTGSMEITGGLHVTGTSANVMTIRGLPSSDPVNDGQLYYLSGDNFGGSADVQVLCISTGSG